MIHVAGWLRLPQSDDLHHQACTPCSGWRTVAGMLRAVLHKAYKGAWLAA